MANQQQLDSESEASARLALKEGDTLKLTGENGKIAYQKLNMALLNKYKNPIRILYLWAVQELLEVSALLESFKTQANLEEKRHKLMKKIKMTDE